jgi:hypothetical protein
MSTTDFEHIDPEFLDTLESTGIIDAYEYVLRKLINDSLPKDEVYERCARYLLEYKTLVLENNIRAKNAKSFYELSYLETGKKEEKRVEEIIPTYKVTLRSKLLLDQEENKSPTKIFETNIDELIKNRLNLLSKKAFNEENRSNIKEYGSFSAYVENENEKLRMYNFKINVKFDNFVFKQIEDIEKENVNEQSEEINLNNLNPNISKKSSRKSTKRRNTEKSKESETESIKSKSVTPSEASKIKKETENIVDELFNNIKNKE